MLINATFWTIVAYFIWHSLHARVEANWFAPVYRRSRSRPRSPPFSRMGPRPQRIVDFCLRWASPAGILMLRC
jgi:hypothetical protein